MKKLLNDEELVYPVKTLDLYYKFLNWLLGEFDLYQCEIHENFLSIQYPLVRCLVKKTIRGDEVIAIIKISSPSSEQKRKFYIQIDNLFNLFRKSHIILK